MGIDGKPINEYRDNPYNVNYNRVSKKALGLIHPPKKIETIDDLFSKELLEEDGEDIDAMEEINPA